MAKKLSLIELLEKAEEAYKNLKARVGDVATLEITPKSKLSAVEKAKLKEARKAVKLEQKTVDAIRKMIDKYFDD